MKSFFLAWQFLTILPGRKSDQEINPRLLGRSMAFYPVIGLLLGLILWAAHWIFSLAFPRTLVDGLIVMLLVLLTGAFHLDGLADTCDGLASGKTPEERMKIGLILILGIKLLALNALPERTGETALLLALVLSRWSMVQLTYRAPYARREGGLGLPFKENLAKREMVVATATALVLSFFFYRFWGMILWLVVGVFTVFFQKFFENKIGGITGDILGAANETNEVLVLILMSGMFHMGY